MSSFGDLLDRARAKEPAALDALMRRESPRLLAFVRLNSGGLLRRREGSLDLAQSVLRDVLAGLPDARCDDEASFRSWLHRAALNKIRSKHAYHTAQKRDLRREEGAAAEDELVLGTYAQLCTPSRDAEAREEIARIEAAFHELPEEYREVILRLRLLGESPQELARELDKSEDALRQLLLRARARLSVLLKDARP